MSATRFALGLLLFAGCTPVELPEPNSAGGQLYATRCGGCHALLPPDSLTAAMWGVQATRMQGEMARRGFAPLTAAEMETLLDYLGRHSAQAEALP